MNRMLINPTGALFIPGPVLTGRLIWVDQLNGNDSVAVVGHINVPFQTLGAAKKAAKPSDTIVVLPGTYNEKNLLKHNVNWHFLNGAIVEYSGSDEGGIFDTSAAAYGTGGAVTSRITGHGIFRMHNASGGHVVHCATGNSSLVIHAQQMFSDAGPVIKGTTSGGSLDVTISENVDANTGDAIYLTTAINSNIRAHRIRTSFGCCLLGLTSGITNIVAHELIAGGSETPSRAAVLISGGTGQTTIRAFEVTCGENPGVRFTATTAAKLYMVGCRIVSNATGAATSGRAVDITTSVNNAVRLLGCTLIASSGGDVSLGGPTSGTVKVHTLGVYANKGSSNVTLIPSGSAFLNLGTDLI